MLYSFIFTAISKWFYQYISIAVCAVTACLEDKLPYNIYYSYMSLVRLQAALPAAILQHHHCTSHKMKMNCKKLHDLWLTLLWWHFLFMNRLTSDTLLKRYQIVTQYAWCVWNRCFFIIRGAVADSMNKLFLSIKPVQSFISLLLQLKVFSNMCTPL